MKRRGGGRTIPVETNHRRPQQCRSPSTFTLTLQSSPRPSRPPRPCHFLEPILELRFSPAVLDCSRNIFLRSFRAETLSWFTNYHSYRRRRLPAPVVRLQLSAGPSCCLLVTIRLPLRHAAPSLLRRLVGRPPSLLPRCTVTARRLHHTLRPWRRCSWTRP